MKFEKSIIIKFLGFKINLCWSYVIEYSEEMLLITYIITTFFQGFLKNLYFIDYDICTVTVTSIPSLTINLKSLK